MSDGAGARPTPSAEGTLEARPLAHLLVYSRTKRLSGKLVLQAPDGRGGAIALWRGQIAAARTSPPIAYFAALASEMGFIDAKIAEATQREAAAARRLHGELLIERGMLTVVQRDAVLVEQTCRKVHHMFALPPPTVFAFYEERPRDVEPPAMVDAIAPVWRGIRDANPGENLKGVLAPFHSGALRVVNEAPISRAGFSEQEMEIANALIKKPMSISRIRITYPRVPADKIERIVYLLLITKAVEAAPTTSASNMPAAKPAGVHRPGTMDPDVIEAVLKASLKPAAAVAPPPSSSALRNSVAPTFPSGSAAVKTHSSIPARRNTGSISGEHSPPSTRSPSSPSNDKASGSWKPVPPPVKPVVGPAELGTAAIRKRAQSVEAEDPFETLDLAAGSSADAARAAFFRLVKLWHPDRLPSELAAVRADVVKIFSVMTSAHHTLTDPDARRVFDAARAEKAALQNRPRKDVIRLIDTALSKKDWSFAADESKKLVEANRDDAEALALVAWAGALAGEGPEPSIRSALHLLDRAVASDSQCARAHFYRGMVQKRLGNLPGAHKDFSRVLALDPKHVDATREVRIYEMRLKNKG